MNKIIIKTVGRFINILSYFSPYFAAHFAILLFSKPKKKYYKPNEIDFLNTATKEILFYENISIATYRWLGTKNTVLLAHGWESNTYRWKDLINVLRIHNYSIIALDAPAHGNSGGKFFNALLYSEFINSVAQKYRVQTIIGHSVGGLSGVFAQKFYKIKTVNTFVLLGAPADFIGIFNRYENIMGYNTIVSKAIKNYVLKHYKHLPEYFSAVNFSKEIEAKLLIIHDKKDRIIPYSDALRYNTYFKNSKLISTKGLGHGLKSNTVYNNILSYLND